jgi:hypothetical protein
MMRTLAALVLLASAAPATACSCSAPETDQEKRDYARFIAGRAEAIVEVEPVPAPTCTARSARPIASSRW